MVLPQQVIVDIYQEYIYNEVPTWLIYVPEMRLVGREYVKNYYQGEAETQLSNLAYHDEDVSKGEVKKVVKYAIFSHRWLPEGEPTFRDLSDGEFLDGEGGEKLGAFCQKAVEYGCVFAWADTCCIDKSSSSELDEAIRSMFRWYRNSYICIAYLSDSSSINDIGNDPWFTRGWTLQELLAPGKMKFFGAEWIPLTGEENDKVDYYQRGILAPISAITNIPIKVLREYKPGLDDITEKLSWASGRRTTRVEDIAYSLIGMLDISLMIAYGEGRRAFFRLMQVIVENTSNHEIFGWKGQPSAYNSALPAAPSCYPRKVRKHRDTQETSHDDTDFALANGRFRIKVLLVPMKGKSIKEVDEGTTSTVLRLTDPNRTIKDVIVDFGNRLRDAEASDYRMDNIALGILDYSNEGGKGVLEHEVRDPYIAFLLTLYNGKWVKMVTENIIEVYPQRVIKKELTALRLDRESADKPLDAKYRRVLM